VLAHDQHRSASGVWVRLADDDLARLDGSSAVARDLPSSAEVMRTGRLSRDALWHRVRRGEYRAFRIPRGQVWQWHL